jgi:hypothetical protein
LKTKALLARSYGALGEIRTPDPRIRSPMLYPAELRARKFFNGLAGSPQVLGPVQALKTTGKGFCLAPG